MYTLSCSDRIGGSDGTASDFEESLYLLNENFVIVGLRPATAATAPPLRRAMIFLRIFPPAPRSDGVCPVCSIRQTRIPISCGREGARS